MKVLEPAAFRCNEALTSSKGTAKAVDDAHSLRCEILLQRLLATETLGALLRLLLVASLQNFVPRRQSRFVIEICTDAVSDGLPRPDAEQWWLRGFKNTRAHHRDDHTKRQNAQ